MYLLKIVMEMGIVSLILQGIASQYAPGVMPRVIANRQAMQHLPAELPVVDGYIAVQHPDLIGDVVYMRPEGQDRWERFLIVDCAAHHDGGYDWMERNGIVAEVDFETAQRWNTIGYGCPVEIIGLSRR